MIIRKGNDGKEYKDFSFDEVTEKVKELTAQGHRCYQKFLCEKCGQRLTIDEPNVFYTEGSCDKCGHITDIKKSGCNYMLIMKRGKDQSHEI